jgi:hypothetical protein
LFDCFAKQVADSEPGAPRLARSLSMVLSVIGKVAALT